MALIGTYNPKDVNFVFGTRATGFAEGSMIEVTRDEPKRFIKKAGAKGEVSRTKNNNDMGTVKIRLKHTSPANRDYYLASKLGAIIPLAITEKGGGRFFGGGSEAWIEEEPSPNLEKEEGVSEWLFGVANLQYGQLGG